MVKLIPRKSLDAIQVTEDSVDKVLLFCGGTTISRDYSGIFIQLKNYPIVVLWDDWLVRHSDDEYGTLSAIEVFDNFEIIGVKQV